MKPDDIDLNGELNTIKLLQEEKVAVYNHYAEVLSRKGTKEPKQRIGTGSYKVTTSDGEVYDLHDAFGGPLSDMFRKIASSGNSFERLVDSNTDMYMRKLSSKGIGAVRPSDPAYFEQWAQTLRQQFGNSAVVNKIVAGDSIEDITKWLRNSPEGRDLRKRLALTSDDFTKNDSSYAISHPMVKSSSNPGLLAHLLGDSIDIDETALILRSAMSDPVAMDELRLQRRYITDALETARGDLSSVDEYKLFAAPDDSGMLPFLNDIKQLQMTLLLTTHLLQKTTSTLQS